MSLVAAIQSSSQDSEDAAYTKIMAPVLDAVEPSQVTGSKAIAYEMDEQEDKRGTYTKTYVPDTWTTDDPEEVRYVVTVEKGSSVVGTYSGGGFGLQGWCKVEIRDLKTGEIVDGNTFYGGNPPQSVKSGGNHYGSAPGTRKVSEWVGKVLESQ